MNADMNFARRTLIEGPGDELAIRWSQEIPQEHIDDLKAQKEENDSNRIPDGFFKVGEVPDYLFLKWLREGYDARLEPVAETLKRLRAEEAHIFVLTNRRI